MTEDPQQGIETKPCVLSDYLVDSDVRRECLRLSIKNDASDDFDDWVIKCYEGIIKEKGGL